MDNANTRNIKFADVTLFLALTYSACISYRYMHKKPDIISLLYLNVHSVVTYTVQDIFSNISAFGNLYLPCTVAVFYVLTE